MKNLKKKICRNPKCSNEFTQYSSLQKYCSQRCMTEDVKKKKKVNKIKPLSDKRAEELATYRPIRDKYLEEHPDCEVKDCDKKSTHIHHKNGRRGKMLYDDNYFMAVCNSCHPVRIHENPEWSRAMGYLI